MGINIGKIAVMVAALGATCLAHSETFSEYLSQCEIDLEITNEGLRGFNCFDGEYVPASSELVLESNAANNYLGRVEYDNPDIDAIFLCRKVTGSSEDIQNATYKFAGYIIQNRVNGNTCFLDGKIGTGQPVTNVLNPPSDNGKWETMPYTNGGKCVNCHTADPFIITPAIAEQAARIGLIGNHRNTKGAYIPVGSFDNDSYFYQWYSDKNDLIDYENTCAESCHRLAKGTSPRRAEINSVATPFMSPTSMFKETQPGVWRRNWYHQNHYFENEWDSHYRIQNVFVPDEFIHIEYGSPDLDPIQNYWWSAQWSFESVWTVDSYYYRIKNRWAPNGADEYLAIDAGGSIVTVSSPNSSAAEWQIVKASAGIAGSNAYHIINRSTGAYLNMYYGFLVGWNNNNYTNSHWLINEVN